MYQYVHIIRSKFHTKSSMDNKSNGNFFLINDHECFTKTSTIDKNEWFYN